MNEFRPVKTLPAETARKIAAGEVIDRPAAIIRELIDNAIDSNPTNIQVEIEEGGIKKIRVTDDGFGMTEDDLKNCAFPHATSKIITESDLANLSTLGFRGEALASIAAVSHLEITSIREGSVGHKLQAFATTTHKVTPCHWAKGTCVQSSSLFENFPARRVFLKKPAAEAKMCRQTFIEKALPWTQIGFRYTADGKQKLNLPAGQPLAERFVQALEIPEEVSYFHEINFGNYKSEGFSGKTVIGDCAVRRSDKKLIYVFVNGRRIWEYSLIQAAEYGSQGYFPNGTFPVAAVFLQINPAFVDFNIHPAKREVRFKDISPIHHAISSSIRDFYRENAVSQLVSGIEPESVLTPQQPDLDNFSVPIKKQTNTYSGLQTHPTSSYQYKPKTYQQTVRDFQASYSDAKILQDYDKHDNSDTQEQNTQNDVRYIGTVLGVFLVAEKDQTLYLIDQHAAHERILYNRFMENLGNKQPLLFPYVIETETQQDDDYLQTLLPELEKAGFTMQNRGSGSWEVSTVPIKWTGTEEDLSQALLAERLQPKDLVSKLGATAACKAAVKDGTVLDFQTASDLAEQALSLPDPHCPHGRPIFTVLTKEMLFQMVRRTE